MCFNIILMQAVSDSVDFVVHYAPVPACDAFPGCSRKCTGSLFDVVLLSRTPRCCGTKKKKKKSFWGACLLGFVSATLLCLHTQLYSVRLESTDGRALHKKPKSSLLSHVAF